MARERLEASGAAGTAAPGTGEEAGGDGAVGAIGRTLRRVLPTLSAAFVIAVIEVVVAASFAALIFAGPLARHVRPAIGLTLLSGVVMMATVALLASTRGMVASVQDVSAAILALSAASIAERLPASGEAAFPTVVAALAVTTAASGLLFLALGGLRLGDLVRFVPYPVVGGFLAGSGWLLVTGAGSMLADVPIAMANAPALGRPAAVAMWLPGVGFAVGLLVLVRRSSHALLVPGSLIAAVAAFWVAVAATGTGSSGAEANGWLLGPFPGGTLLRGLSAEAFTAADWGVVVAEAANLAPVLVVSLLALLLNASGIELATDRDVDLNRELRAAGVANVAAGLTGGLVGFHALSLTALAHRGGGGTRAVGVVAASLIAAVALFGASVLSLFPRFVLGGVILFLGLAFLVEWVVDARSRLTRSEYLVVLLILVMVAVAGFVQAVALGLVVAIVLFVVNYSRTDVVRHTLDGTTFSSNVERPPREREALRRVGGEIHVLELQGFIFFGTAKTLLDRVAARAGDASLLPLRFLVLDFRRVTGLDSSAVMSFAKVLKLAVAGGFEVVLAGCSDRVRALLGQSGADEAERLRFFPDLDHAVQWCEDELLVREGEADDRGPGSLRERLGALLGSDVDVRRLEPYLHRVDVEAGTLVIRQGDVAEDLYFLDSGRVTARLDSGDGPGVRLRTMGPGTVVGELPLYLGTPRTASVVADEPSVLYRVSLDDFREMERRDPDLAAALHRLFARLLAQRLADSLQTMNALLR